MAENRRTETARANDDHEMIDSIEPTPPQGGTSGGNLQDDIATRDELKQVAKGDPSLTRPHGSDEPPTRIPTRADNEGANG